MHIYTMPDGTQTYNRPKDGDLFQLYDSNRVFQSEWMWDDLKEHWYKRSQVGTLSNGQPIVFLNSKTPTVSATFNGSPINEEGLSDDEVRHLFGGGCNKILKCECGAEKINSQRHSTWCVKHTNE